MANLHDHTETKSEGASGRGGGSGAASMVSEAQSEVGAAMHEVGRQARKTAASLAAEANERMSGLLDRQVEAGADLAGQVAESVRAAAESLDEAAPQLADLVRGAADTIDDFSDDVRDLSAGELFEAGSDFARRRPALVFGGAAIAGFLLYRVLNASAGNERARSGGRRVAKGTGGKRKPVRKAAKTGARRREPGRGA